MIEADEARIRMKRDGLEMSDRFSVVIPDEIGKDLKRWADMEGRAKANLAAFLLEVAVKKRFPEKYESSTIQGEERSQC